MKSDDVSGRTKVYEAIVRGDDDFESASSILQRSGQGAPLLGLNVDLHEAEYRSRPHFPDDATFRWEMT